MDYLAGDRSQEQRETLEALLELSKNLADDEDAFFVLDRQWRFTYLNPQAGQLLLRSTEELMGKCIWDEFPETVNSSFYREYRRALADRVMVHFEEFYLPLETWFEVRAYPDRDRLSVYLRDITVRKQTEAELLERLRLYTLETEVGAALARGGMASKSLNRCCSALVEHLDAKFAGIWFLSLGKNPDTQYQLLEIQADAGELEFGRWVTGEDWFSRQPLTLDGSLIGFVAHTRQPYLTQDSKSKGGLESRVYNTHVAESCLLIGDSYFAGYPLIVEQRLIAIIAVVKSQPFSEAACEMLDWVAQAIAQAIAIQAQNSMQRNPVSTDSGAWRGSAITRSRSNRR